MQLLKLRKYQRKFNDPTGFSESSLLQKKWKLILPSINFAEMDLEG